MDSVECMCCLVIKLTPSGSRFRRLDERSSQFDSTDWFIVYAAISCVVSTWTVSGLFLGVTIVISVSGVVAYLR